MSLLLKKIKEADYSLQKANHLLKITFPLLKHKKILIKVTKEIKSAILKQIAVILYYEKIKNKLKLSKKPTKNLILFKKKLAKKYGVNTKKLEEILELSEEIKNCPVQVLKENKLILISKDLKQVVITEKSLEDYLTQAEKLFKNLKSSLKAETPRKG